MTPSSYAVARNEALDASQLADTLFAVSLNADPSPAREACVCQAAGWLDRVALGLWREAAMLWEEGGVA